MPKAKTSRKKRPAMSPEARENQLISLAYQRAEEQLEAGTASSQVITHFLKLGSQKTQLEKEKLEEENKLLRAKTEALEAQKASEAMYKEAMEAFKRYSGLKDVIDDEML